MSLETFLESLCPGMIAVARLTAYKPKISTENAATDRKLFVCHFPLSFLREIWLLTYTVLTYMGRGNVARVSMRGRWIVHDDIMIMIMMMTMKMKKPLRSRVWPLMTIRKRRWGVRLSEELGEAETKIRGLEEFRKNLPPFWKNLNRPCPSQRNFFEDNSIYFEREECLRTRAVFLECWQMALKFSRLVPNIQLRGRSSVSFTSRSNPPPQLAKKNFVNVGANVENYFFFVCVTIVFFMETGSKLELYCEFFRPRFTDVRHNLVCRSRRKR